jgi:hypothetical protein
MSSLAGRAWRGFRGAPIALQVVCWVVVALLALGAAFSDKHAKTAAAQPNPSSSSTIVPAERHAAVLAAGQSDLDHPSASLTPGAALADVTAEQVCVSGYSSSVRDVSSDVRDQVFVEYGLTDVDRSAYEVDHLIALELGGSNEVRNLWPEPMGGADGAKVKDATENRLHDLVCNSQLTLTEAQSAILHWDTVNIDALITTTTTTPPTTTVVPRTTAPATTTPSAYYANCTEARQAGAAPIYRGQPGYRPALDRDGDGIACE